MTDDDHGPNPLISRRTLVANAAAAGLIGSGAGARAGAPPPSDVDIALEIYRGFSQNELDRWDRVIHPDVKGNSPAGRGIAGLATLKRFNQAFLDAFRPRTDLIDHFVAGDRGMVVVNLHWTHDSVFNGIPPTGRSGTSVECFLLRIDKGLVVRWDVADASLDLANYLHDQRMALPTFVEPPAEIRGRPLPPRKRA